MRCTRDALSLSLCVCFVCVQKQQNNLKLLGELQIWNCIIPSRSNEMRAQRRSVTRQTERVRECRAEDAATADCLDYTTHYSFLRTYREEAQMAVGVRESVSSFGFSTSIERQDEMVGVHIVYNGNSLVSIQRTKKKNANRFHV